MLDIQTPIGVVISETENQHQDTYFRLVEQQSAGRVTRRHVWCCQLLKQLEYIVLVAAAQVATTYH